MISFLLPSKHDKDVVEMTDPTISGAMGWLSRPMGLGLNQIIGRL